MPFVPRCLKTAKIRVKNREPVPAYAMADADRDSDLGDDSPVVSAVFNSPSLPWQPAVNCLSPVQKIVHYWIWIDLFEVVT